jgi:hypothetical protein
MVNLNDINKKYLGDTEMHKKDNIGYASVRADKEPESTDYENVQELEQIDPTQLETYDQQPEPEDNVQYQQTYQFDADTISDPEPDTSMTDSEKTKVGKFFGFVKNKFDIATEGFKQKNDIKNEVYRDYLEQNPKVLAEVYKQKYAQELQNKVKKRDIREQKMNQLDQRFVQKLGIMFGGAHMQPVKYQNPGVVGAHMQPVKYQKPGVVGAQVPKYSAAPRNSEPGVSWQRVVKIDKHGKKRSYLRKARVPEYQQQPQQQQQMQPQQQEQQTMNPMMQGMNYNINQLDNMSRVSGLPNMQVNERVDTQES